MYKRQDPGRRENSEKSVTEHDIDRIVCSMYSFVENDLTITKHLSLIHISVVRAKCRPADALAGRHK